jgi:hypothetical protein
MSDFTTSVSTFSKNSSFAATPLDDEAVLDNFFVEFPTFDVGRSDSISSVAGK